MIFKNFWGLLKDAGIDWYQDDASMHAAALSYYTVFSLAPLLLIAVALAGMAFGRQAAEGHIFNQLQGFLGSQGAHMVQRMIAGINHPRSNLIATIMGAIILLLGASIVFLQLQSTLNSLWKVRPKPGIDFGNFIRLRLISLAIVVGSGFLLLVSLIISAVLSRLDRIVSDILPRSVLAAYVLDNAISIVLIGVIFAVIFKMLPDVHNRWRDIWPGALLTSVLFNIGKFLIGLYLGKSSVTSGYGAATSLVIILLWVYYAAQILLYGAEFTKVYTQRYGSSLSPGTGAVREASSGDGEKKR